MYQAPRGPCPAPTLTASICTCPAGGPLHHLVVWNQNQWLFKVKPLHYKIFSNTLQFANHLPIWSLTPAMKTGIVITVIQMWKLAFRNTKQLGKDCPVSKWNTSLPTLTPSMFSTHGPQFDQQCFQIFTMASHFQTRVLTTCDFSPPPHLHG